VAFPPPVTGVPTALVSARLVAERIIDELGVGDDGGRRRTPLGVKDLDGSSEQGDSSKPQHTFQRSAYIWIVIYITIPTF